MSENQTAFDSWCIVEVMGRKVVAGRVTEQVIAGQGFVRVDVPAAGSQAAFTQMFGPGSIYAITPTTEEVATAFVARSVGAPIQPYQLALPEKVIPQTESNEPFYCVECQTFVPASRWDESAGKCLDCSAPF